MKHPTSRDLRNAVVLAVFVTVVVTLAVVDRSCRHAPPEPAGPSHSVAP